MIGPVRNRLPHLRALVVEDSLREAQLIEAVLTTIGVAHVSRAVDGAEALEMVKNAEESFGLVISDWMMPGMDGIEFLERFRRDNQNTPFIMLTAKTAAKDFQKAKELGANYFLMKPLTADEMGIRIQGVIDVTVH